MSHAEILSGLRCGQAYDALYDLPCGDSHIFHLLSIRLSIAFIWSISICWLDMTCTIAGLPRFASITLTSPQPST